VLWSNFVGLMEEGLQKCYKDCEGWCNGLYFSCIPTTAQVITTSSYPLHHLKMPCCQCIYHINPVYITTKNSRLGLIWMFDSKNACDCVIKEGWKIVTLINNTKFLTASTKICVHTHGFCEKTGIMFWNVFAGWNMQGVLSSRGTGHNGSILWVCHPSWQ